MRPREVLNVVVMADQALVGLPVLDRWGFICAYDFVFEVNFLLLPSLASLIWGGGGGAYQTMQHVTGGWHQGGRCR